MRILVTGGTGFIGSHTVVELLLDGHDVVIVDNLSNSEKSVVDAIEKITQIRPLFYEVDVTDQHKMDEIFKNIHLMALFTLRVIRLLVNPLRNLLCITTIMF